jgi:nucleoside-diphosphate-sugar epimerase
MRVVIAGAHGKIGLLLGRRLSERGDAVLGIVRNPAHEADLRAAGMEPVVVDLESATVDDVAPLLDGAHAVVFTAGAGPGSGVARKDTVDRAASVLLAGAAERAGVRRFVQVSAMGVEGVRGDSTGPDDEVFHAYLVAKLAAEDDLRARKLDWTILRPGGLTDDPATGRVTLAPTVEPGRVPRDDVAAVLVDLLDRPETAGQVLELVAAGPAPAR